MICWRRNSQTIFSEEHSVLGGIFQPRKTSFVSLVLAGVPKGTWSKELLISLRGNFFDNGLRSGLQKFSIKNRATIKVEYCFSCPPTKENQLLYIPAPDILVTSADVNPVVDSHA